MQAPALPDQRFADNWLVHLTRTGLGQTDDLGSATTFNLSVLRRYGRQPAVSNRTLLR